MLLGCIADDLTGATDLALTLRRGGMRVLLTVGKPGRRTNLADADAVVVALKSRMAPAKEAVGQSLSAAAFLRDAGAEQIFFKYCSTFDSTDAGNIGPVAEALLADARGGIAIACPAFPATGRKVYQGHLFVNGVPLGESPMKDHPLTPMRDSNLVRVLQRQTKKTVGLVGLDAVDEGPLAIRTALAKLEGTERSLAIVDATFDRHLIDIGAAVQDAPLVTGASGAALGLPLNFMRAGRLEKSKSLRPMEARSGATAILAGSCSAMTRIQIAAALGAGLRHFHLDVDALVTGAVTVEDVLRWAKPRLGVEPILIYSSADPAGVAEAQTRHGRAEAGELVERVIAGIASKLVEAGVTRLIVAGGETSGAVVGALDLGLFEVGTEIDPGVPWVHAVGTQPLALALKSGNFGAVDFFLKASRASA